MTFRGTENTLLGTGRQPFVLDVIIGIVKCVGTLISPMHVLTLASCFMLDRDLFDIESNVMRRCGVKKGWQNCNRWFKVVKESRYGRGQVIVKTPENIHGNSARLPVHWFEIHPLFDGQEFDLAIIGLKSNVQRTLGLHPICLPKWNIFDIQGKPVNDRLYKSLQWENHQMLYSLKAVHKDVRFSSVWTDVNGPSKFMKCKLDQGGSESTNWKKYCHISEYTVGFEELF